MSIEIVNSRRYPQRGRTVYFRTDPRLSRNNQLETLLLSARERVGWDGKVGDKREKDIGMHPIFFLFFFHNSRFMVLLDGELRLENGLRVFFVLDDIARSI